MYPRLEIGPVTLQTFGLMFALAFLAAGALVAKRLAEIGKPVDWAYEMGFAALIGGVVGRDFLGPALLDLAAPALALGYAIGRCGCQLSGDGDYGKPWDGPWAMSYPNGTVPTDRTVHPTPVYETLAMGLGAWILWQLRDRLRTGVLFAIYLLYAGTERFLVEFVRRNSEVALGLTAAQLESLGMILAGSIWIAAVWRRHGSLSRVPSTEPIGPVAGL